MASNLKAKGEMGDQRTGLWKWQQMSQSIKRKYQCLCWESPTAVWAAEKILFMRGVSLNRVHVDQRHICIAWGVSSVMTTTLFLKSDCLALNPISFSHATLMKFLN